MSGITAAAVKTLRERTGLPMMDCKKALSRSGRRSRCGGRPATKAWRKVAAERAGRDTEFGRMGIYTSPRGRGDGRAQMRERSRDKERRVPAAGTDLAQQLATGPGAADGDELLAQPSPSKDGMTLKDQLEDLFNRIREVFKVGRIVRIDGPCGGYSHNAATVSGSCSKRPAATKPSSRISACILRRCAPKR